MALRTFLGRDDAEALIGDDQQLRRRTPEFGQVQFSLVASDFDSETVPPRWNVVKDRAMVSLIRAAAPKIEDL